MPQPATLGTFLPGSMAEHLTSHSGTFTSIHHTKMTEWLRAGATASAAPVVEPYALWTKFPHARFFVHRALGYTMLESFFLAIRCPLQVLLMGEPLNRLKTAPFAITLVSLNDGPLSGDAVFYAQVSPRQWTTNITYRFYLDGCEIDEPSAQGSLSLDTTVISDGYHTLRAVGYLKGPISHQRFSVKTFEVNNRSRRVELAGVSPGQKVDFFHPLRLRVIAEGSPVRIGILGNGRVLDEIRDVNPSFFSLDPRILGKGPNRLQGMAVYEDDMMVRSVPVEIDVETLNNAPRIEAIETIGAPQGHLRLKSSVVDAENDPVTLDWLQVLSDFFMDADNNPAVKIKNAAIKCASNGLYYTPLNNLSYAVWSAPVPQCAEIKTDLIIYPNGRGGVRGTRAGVIFGFKDEQNFGFFGADGMLGAWIIGYYYHGELKRKSTRGAYLKHDQRYQLSLRHTTKGTMEGWVNGEKMCEWTTNPVVWDGGAGIMAVEGNAQFEYIAIAPPFSVDVSRDPDSPFFLVEKKTTNITAALLLRASDDHAVTERTIALETLTTQVER